MAGRGRLPSLLDDGDDDPTSELGTDDPTADLGNTAYVPQPAEKELKNDSRSARSAGPAEAVPVPRRVDVGPGLVLRERYLLQQVIGSGGTSMVYRAQDLRHEAGASSTRVIAVKLLREELREDARAIERLKREFTQMQLLAHPGVLKVFDLDVDQGVWFMTMELLEGQSLNMYLRTNRAPHPQALELVKSCAEALQFAHERGIVHGDLKPGNIFLTGAGARVLDFIGAADELRADRAATPAYASPQRLAGELPDVGDDVYSLGCVAYEMLTGVHPFERKPANVAHQLGLQPARINSLSYRQWRALDRALAFDRRDRHASMRAFADALCHDEPKISALSSNVPPDEDVPATDVDGLGAVPTAGIIPVALPAAVLVLPPQAEPVTSVTQSPAAEAPPTPATTPADASTHDASFGLSPREGLIEPLKGVETRTAMPLPPLFEPPRRGAMLPIVIALLLAGLAFYVARSGEQMGADDSQPSATSSADAAEPKSPLAAPPALAPTAAVPLSDQTAAVPARDMAGAAQSQAVPASTGAVVSSSPVTKSVATRGATAARTSANPVGFVTSRVSVSERSVAAVIQVKRLGTSTARRIPVHWRTEKRSAKPGEDYTEVSSGTLILQEGQRMGAIYVPIKNDDDSESDEMFVVELKNPAATAASDIGLAIVTIRDDDRVLLTANPE